MSKKLLDWPLVVEEVVETRYYATEDIYTQNKDEKTGKYYKVMEYQTWQKIDPLMIFKFKKDQYYKVKDIKDVHYDNTSEYIDYLDYEEQKKQKRIQARHTSHQERVTKWKSMKDFRRDLYAKKKT